jgi:hypothetical protein
MGPLTILLTVTLVVIAIYSLLTISVNKKDGVVHIALFTVLVLFLLSIVIVMNKLA